jgi:uncharacterized protein HemY
MAAGDVDAARAGVDKLAELAADHPQPWLAALA